MSMQTSASVDHAPLLSEIQRSRGISRKLAALTFFQLKNSIASGRHTQVFLPLLFYLVLLVVSRSAFPDKHYPEVTHPRSFFSDPQCAFSRETRVGLEFGVVCEDSEEVCESRRKLLIDRLGVANVTRFQTKEDLMETILAQSDMWGGVSYGNGSVSIAMRGADLPNRAETTSGNFLECRPEQQCAIADYEGGCLGLFAESAMQTEIEWKLFPMSELFVSGLKASSVLWLVPVYISFLFVNLSVISLVDLAREIERKSIDFMHTHGVGRTLYFASFSVVNLSYGLVQILVITFVLQQYNIFPNTSVLVVLPALLLFFLFLSLSTFALARVSSTPRAASLLGTAVDLALLGLGVLGRGDMTVSKFFLGILFPSVPLFGLLDVVGEREAVGGAAGWEEVRFFFVALVLGVGLHFQIARIAWMQTPQARRDAVTSLPVRITEAVKIYGNGTRALQGLGLDLRPAERLVLIGGNGAGKSTLQRAILGLEQLDEGTVETCECVGACFQEDILYEDTRVLDHISLISMIHGVDSAKVASLQVLLGLTAELCEREVKKLSGGEKRRLSLLLTLMNVQAGVLVLDEPTAGVDVDGRKHMWDAIKQDGRPCIIATHYLDEAMEIADRIVLMRDGAVVEEVDAKDERMTAKILTIRPVNPATIHAVQNFFPNVQAVQSDDALSITVTDKQAQSIVACVQYLENSGEQPQISVEPQSLEAMLAAQIPEEAVRAAQHDVRILNEPLRAPPSIVQAAWAFGRLRVINKLHSYQAAAGHFLIPMLMVAASVIVVKMNRFLMGNAGGPQLSGWDKMNFSDENTVSTESFVVPVALGANFPLPETIPRLEVTGDLEDYLILHPEHPFAVGSSNIIYVNPAFPNSLPFVISLASGVKLFEVVPVLSVVELTILSFPVFLPFVLFFALALHRLAVDGAVVVAEEKATQSAHFWQMHGLERASYWLGTFGAQLVLCTPVVIGILIIGSLLFKLSFNSFGYLCIAGIANITVLLVTSFIHAQSFPLTADAFLKWYPTVTGVCYESITVTTAMAVTALFSTGRSELCLAVHGIVSAVIPTYPLVGSLIFLLVERAICEAPGLANRCNEGEAGKFLWTPVVVQASLCLLGLTWLAWEGRRNDRREYLRVSGHADSDEIHSEEIFGFSHVFHTYDSERWALRDLCLRMRSGCLALLGPNGSGKSTAMEIATQFLFPTAGRVLADEQRSGRGYCAQHGKFLFRDCPVIENLRLVASLRGASAEVMQLSVVGAMGGKSLTELSGGMRRRMEVIIALIGNPDLVILDEPTTGVDVEKKREIWQMIRNSNSVILSSHSMEEVERLATNVLVLVNGQRKFLIPAKNVGVRIWGSDVDFPGWKKVADGRYVVDTSGTCLSEVLATLENFKRNRVISNYTVGGHSVEDDYLDCVSS